MNKIKTGLLLGAIAGLVDITPMLLVKLPWSANLSAFTMWVVVGLFIATSNVNLKGALKGILISFLTLAPLAIIIAAQNPMDLIPVLIMTSVLGGLLGFFIAD